MLTRQEVIKILELCDKRIDAKLASYAGTNKLEPTAFELAYMGHYTGNMQVEHSTLRQLLRHLDMTKSVSDADSSIEEDVASSSGTIVQECTCDVSGITARLVIVENKATELDEAVQELSARITYSDGRIEENAKSINEIYELLDGIEGISTDFGVYNSESINIFKLCRK